MKLSKFKYIALLELGILLIVIFPLSVIILVEPEKYNIVPAGILV